MAKNEPHGHQEHKCCGMLEEAATRSLERREKRREKPQPWIVLKIAVAITVGIIAYGFYVYIGRFCVPMIRNNDGALGGRKIGIPFLIVFCILGIMLWWAYIKVVITSPGKAKDYAEKCGPPVMRSPLPPWWDSRSDIGGEPYVPAPPSEGPTSVPPTDSNHGTTHESGPSSSSPSPTNESRRKPQEVDGAVDNAEHVRTTRVRSHSNGIVPTANGNQAPPNLPPMMFSRRPSTTPVLLPEFRYCHKDGFIKPTRSHHCRACGTCILKYDHHCPWIGQCVGARNHKFFVNCLQWTMLFCLWSFATLLAATIKDNRDPNRDVDPQYIVALALAALFGFFSATLLVTHTRMILLNLSTLESMGLSRMEEREKNVLARLHSFYQLSAKRRTRKLWDEEWGSITTDGNLWSLGSYRKNWEAVMGHSVYEWFLPIGQSDGDGVTYPTNPRFDKEGRWRPRREWPAELR